MCFFFLFFFFTDNNESCESLWNRVCVKEPDGLREEARAVTITALPLHRGNEMPPRC